MTRVLLFCCLIQKTNFRSRITRRKYNWKQKKTESLVRTKIWMSWSPFNVSDSFFWLRDIDTALKSEKIIIVRLILPKWLFSNLNSLNNWLQMKWCFDFDLWSLFRPLKMGRNFVFGCVLVFRFPRKFSYHKYVSERDEWYIILKLFQSRFYRLWIFLKFSQWSSNVHFMEIN